MILIIIRALGTGFKAWERGLRVGNRRTNQDYPDYSIVKIGQNTQESPGDLKRLAVTQTPVNDHQLKLV